jgi:hypothetical protein
VRFDSSRAVHLVERLIDVLIIRSKEEAARTMAEIEEIRKDVFSTFIKDEKMKNEKYIEFIGKLTEKDESPGTFTFDTEHMKMELVNENSETNLLDKLAIHRKNRELIKNFFIKVFKDLIVVENTPPSTQKILYEEVGGKVHFTFHNGRDHGEDLHIYFQQAFGDRPEINYWISTKEIVFYNPGGGH